MQSIGAIYLLIVAVILWAIALGLLVRQTSFLLRSRATHGLLVDWVARGTSDSGLHYWYPILRYTDSHGVAHDIRGNTGRAARERPPLPPGRHYPVRYLIEKPSRAQVAAFFHFWLAPIVLTILAAAATFACGYQSGLW